MKSVVLFLSPRAPTPLYGKVHKFESVMRLDTLVRDYACTYTWLLIDGIDVPFPWDILRIFVSEITFLEP